MMLAKSMTILRALANSAGAGLQAGQIVDATGINRITMHRLVKSLEHEGLVEQDGDRRYHLGAQAWLLGLAAGRRFDIVTLAADSLDRLEAETHDTIYLLRRVGDEVLCVARRDGTYPIKSLVMEVGKSYPLGVGGGGLAVLSCLDAAETKATLDRVRGKLPAYPKVSLAKIRKLLDDTRSQGYAFWPALISEAFVVAVPILGGDGKPVGALSCAAIKERLGPARRAKVAALLKAEAKTIERRMGGAKQEKRR